MAQAWCWIAPAWTAAAPRAPAAISPAPPPPVLGSPPSASAPSTAGSARKRRPIAFGPRSNSLPNKANQEHGWFYHWMDVSTGDRKWDSETSSVDTAFLLAGVLTAGQYFADDPEIPKLASEIYDRVDFQWMLNGDPMLLSHGWRNGKGFIKNKWDTYCELGLLYVLAIGSPTHPISPESWYAWQRPFYQYGHYEFVSGGPLFTHQYSQAWIDFRNRRDRGFLDFFLNSVNATRANRAIQSQFGSAQHVRERHLGDYGVGRTQGLSNLRGDQGLRSGGWNRRSGGRRRIADVHARHFHSGPEGHSGTISETACSDATASWMATIRR